MEGGDESVLDGASSFGASLTESCAEAKNFCLSSLERRGECRKMLVRRVDLREAVREVVT